MQQNIRVFVGLDTSKMKISVALAEEGRQGEVRFLGDIENTPHAIRRLVNKLTGKYQKLLFCYEAGPTGYGLHRQITAFGHECSVIAPSLIPRRPGEHVKTNRRDALTLARLHRAGELTTIWVPDPGHEATRDLVRAREAAMEDLRAKRQHLQSFLLRHGRIYRKHSPKTANSLYKRKPELKRPSAGSDGSNSMAAIQQSGSAAYLRCERARRPAMPGDRRRSAWPS